MCLRGFLSGSSQESAEGMFEIVAEVILVLAGLLALADLIRASRKV